MIGSNSGPLSAPRRQLGTRIRELRAGRRLSQESVACAMASRGWPWHKQTVGRVEDGSRRTEFHEVLALADILEVTVTAFMPGGQEVS